MTSPLNSYLGWEQPEHREGCKKPVWDIGVRREEKEYRRTGYGEPQPKHSCREEHCGHENFFTRVVVRVVCRSCGAAQLVTGEDTEETGTTITSTSYLGYGLAPRQAGGLLLWPGEPWLNVGRLASEEPHDFVVTRPGVKHVTKDVIVGQITQGRGSRGAVLWSACAVPDPDGQYGFGQHLRWACANDGSSSTGNSPLRTVAAAARWVAARLAEQQAGGAR